MRWFIVFLLIANVAFFFWVQQESRKLETATLVPPDIGQLHLVDKDEPSLLRRDNKVTQGVERPAPKEAPVLEPEPVEPVRVETVQTEPVLPEAEQIAPDSKSVTVEPPPQVPAVTEVAETELPSEVEAEPSVSSAQVEPLATPTESAEPGVAPGPEAAGVIDEQPPVPDQVSSTERVAERPAEVTPETAALSVDVSPVPEASEVLPDAAAACYRVGPLKAEDADELIAGLPDTIALLSDSTEPTQALIGYYVLIPPLGSIAEGNKKLEELKEAGIADTWLFRRGEYQFAISLGLFSRESSAERHAANVGKKGFDVEVRQRIALRDRRWLQLKDSDGGELGLTLLEGVAAESQSCP